MDKQAITDDLLAIMAALFIEYDQLVERNQYNKTINSELQSYLTVINHISSAVGALTQHFNTIIPKTEQNIFIEIMLEKIMSIPKQ